MNNDTTPTFEETDETTLQSVTLMGAAHDAALIEPILRSSSAAGPPSPKDDNKPLPIFATTTTTPSLPSPCALFDFFCPQKHNVRRVPGEPADVLDRAATFLRNQRFTVTFADNMLVADSFTLKLQVQYVKGELSLSRLCGCCIVMQYTSRALFRALLEADDETTIKEEATEPESCNHRHHGNIACSYQSRMIPRDFCRKFGASCGNPPSFAPLLTNVRRLLQSEKLDEQRCGLELCRDNKHLLTNDDILSEYSAQILEKRRTARKGSNDLDWSLYKLLLTVLLMVQPKAAAGGQQQQQSDDALLLDLAAAQQRPDVAALAARLLLDNTTTTTNHHLLDTALEAHGVALDLRHQGLAEATRRLLEQQQHVQNNHNNHNEYYYY